MESFFTDIGLPLSYVLLAIAVLVAVGFALKTVINDFKGAIMPVIGVVVLLVIFFISYAAADSEVTPKMVKYGVDEGTSKFIGGLISTAISLFVIGLIVGFAGQIYTMLKR